MSSRKIKDAIAVVGMGCTFPGALAPEELWANVLAGRRYFRTMQPERLPRDEYYDPDPRAPGKSYCDQMAVIEGWEFDPLAYRIPPLTAYATDIAHWLALDTAHRALQDSAIELNELPKPRTGVVLGNSLGGEYARSHYLRFRWPYVARNLRRVLAASGADEEYTESVVAAMQALYEAPLPEINEDSLAGNMSNTIAGRICNYFDFGAGGYTVDGACSSSLLAVAKACDALLSGEMDMALAGGVDVSLDAFEVVGFSKTQALSEDDIRPYSAHANGMLTGEGCGFFVLMRAEDAERAGRRIRALVRGWGVSSDGAGGMTAPGVDGQVRALRATYERAGYSIGSVGLIEGHGTGTMLGDKVELTALRRLIDASPEQTEVRIGSIKASIGHCKAAAGSAGLIKAIMALERKILPPTLNCTHPHPLLCESGSRLRASTPGMPWARHGNVPRRASVSAMGFGGANAHVTVEESQPRVVPRASDLALLRSARVSEVIVLAADTIDDLRAQIERVRAVAARICRAEMTDMAATLAADQPCGRLRLAIVSDAPWHLQEQLAQVAEKLDSGEELAACSNTDTGIFAGTALGNPSCVMLFPGQGAQFENMGAELVRAYPFVEEFWTEIDKALARQMRGGLSTRVIRPGYLDEAARAQRREALAQTETAQPAIVATSLAIAKVLEHAGLQPTAVLGHSLGELAALQVAGTCTPVDAVRLAAARGKAMGSIEGSEPGGMVAVRCAPEELAPLVAMCPGYSVIANYNSPRQTVVSGEERALEALKSLCDARDIRCRRLPVSHAFHSRMVAPAADAFAGALKRAPLVQPALPVISSVTGAQLEERTRVRALLREQITAPVRFISAVHAAAEMQPDLWIEVGPQAVLSGLVRAICGSETPCVATQVEGEDALAQIDRVLARAFVLGFPVDLARQYEFRYTRPFALDYTPKFIVNPCERPVDDLALDVAQVPGTLVVPAIAPAAASAEEQDETAGDGILAFAVNWIAQRTGFPTSAIQPEMKLRDDLNLDSIKVGELVYNVSRKLNKQVPADPSAYANARLSKLLAVIQNDFKDLASEMQSDVTGVTGAAPLPGLAEWVHTFEVTNVPAPLSEEKFQRLPTHGSLCVVGDPDCPRVQAFAQRMRQHGLYTVVQDPEAIGDATAAPDALAMLVYILPGQQAESDELSDSAFAAQIDTTLTRLFRVFKWATHELDPSWTNVRCVIARPYVSPNDGPRSEMPVAYGEQLDAGHAFLRSLQLEHTAFQPKWLCLPGDWTPEQWATLIEKELQTGGRRVLYSYAPDATRYTKAAVRAKVDGRPTTDLAPGDVVLCTGGAKGITFELARGLARKTDVALALLGRSAAPPDDDTSSAIAANIARLRQEGIRCCYVQCDVTDAAAVARAVAQTEAELGPVKGLLHGAGMTVPCLFREMAEQQFVDTVRVKVLGLHNLLKHVSRDRLKMLHVITSVLGHTGMSGQVDYTLANAWLDGMIRHIQARRPELHCLTLGYSIWSETGIGKRLGAVESLHAGGTTPIDTAEGVAAYVAVCDRRMPAPTLAITGRLNGEIDPQFFPPLPPSQRRFLRKVLRYVPDTECIAEATLAHDTDLYLSEHVYEGTPVVPAVMTLEAIVEVAQYCLGRSDLPVLEAVRFERAIIVPFDGRVTLRVLTLVTDSTDGIARVKAAVYVDSDSFQGAQLTAELTFGAEPPVPDRAMPRIEGDIGRAPEEFHPVPLFQGKFFRRIVAIRKAEFAEQVVTDVVIPEGERYYSLDLPNGTALPSPAARDAFLHSGILALPAGSLPASITRMCVFGAAPAGATVVCLGNVVEKHGDGEYVSDLTVFDAASGTVLETIEGVMTRVPQSREATAVPTPSAPTPMVRLAEDLSALMPDVSVALGLALHGEVDAAAELTTADRAALGNVAPARRADVLAGLVAARRAACALARDHAGLALDPQRIHIRHAGNGAPCLSVDDPAAMPYFADMALSLTDARGCALALIASAPVGIDIEPVEQRDAETWRALLSDDGYAQALALARATSEPFDYAATRVWALLEASKKAHRLRRILPRYDAPRGGAWHSSTSMADGARVENLSVVVSNGEAMPCAALALTLPCSEPTAAADSRAAEREFDAVLEDFTQHVRLFTERFARDPDDQDTEAHHVEFNAWIDATIERLNAVERAADPSALYTMRQRMLDRLGEYLGDSEIVRHAIDKPYGYTGDFEMLEKLLRNKTNATGFPYHLDRAQLEYPASEACRNRVTWVCEEARAIIAERGCAELRLLDIGIGSAPVERTLLERIPELDLYLRAIDIEPAALAFIEQQLQGRTRALDLRRVDLRREESAQEVAAMAEGIDMCVAIGIFEALRDEELIRLVRTLRQAMQPGTLILGEAFLPEHPTRAHMEWFMDYHLGYRSPDEVCALLARAGVPDDHLLLPTESSGSSGLFRITV